MINQRRKYYVSILNFNSNNSWQSEGDNTGDICFMNTGQDPVTVNGVLLNTTHFIRIEANDLESDMTKYSWIFSNLFPVQSFTLTIKKFI